MKRKARRVKRSARKATRSTRRIVPLAKVIQDDPPKWTAVLLGITGGIREVTMSGPPPNAINVPVADDASGEHQFLAARFERDHGTQGTGSNLQRIYYRERGTFREIRKSMLARVRERVEAVLAHRGRRRVPLRKAMRALFEAELQALEPKVQNGGNLIPVSLERALFRLMSPVDAFPPDHPNCRSVRT